MLDDALGVFGIKADIDLNLMKPSQDLFDVTSAVLLGMKSVFQEINPDLVLVHGDTTTAMATAVACFYSNIPVGHIEAGLRTSDISSPFPEEFNRQTISKLSTWHFAPTERCRKNLLAEHFSPESIFVTGNTVVDALTWMLKEIERDSARWVRVSNKISTFLSFDWHRERFVLVTGHRRENFGTGFQGITEALRRLALRFPRTHFVYPVHLNPSVQAPVRATLSNIQNVLLIDPVDYEVFVILLKHSFLVLTDSGGIQEEAPTFAKPVIVMRDKTERQEAIEAGTAALVGADPERIIEAVTRLLVSDMDYLKMASATNPYGDGRAAERIVQSLEERL